MAPRPSSKEPGDILALRREAGAWLRARREELDLTQGELARLVGSDYYSFISQIESGRGKIPSDRYRSWAGALQVEPRVLVEKLLRYYDPPVFNILFGDHKTSE